jgi:hypothetical protein
MVQNDLFQLYVENGGVNAWGRSEQKPTLQIVSLASNAMAQLRQHVRNHHANERSIFDQKYRCHMRCPRALYPITWTFNIAPTSLTAHHNCRIYKFERKRPVVGSRMDVTKLGF